MIRLMWLILVNMTKLDVLDGIEPIDLVRYYFGEFSEGEAEEFLWRETSYPFCDKVVLFGEVWDYYLKNRI